MTHQQYLKLKKRIEQALIELEAEATRKGMLFSDKYEKAILEVKKKVIEKSGFTLSEYLEKEDKEEQVPEFNLSIKELNETLKEKLEEKVGEEVKKIAIPTKEEIEEISRQIAKEYIVPPINKTEIVKEIVKEKPIYNVVKETIKEIDNSLIDELKKDILKVQGEYLDVYGRLPDKNEIIREVKQDLDTSLVELNNDILKRIDDKALNTLVPERIWKEIRETQTVELRRSNYSLDLSIGKLNDVDITGITSGQILKWDGSKFEPASDEASLWQRTGTTISPLTAGDDVDLGTGNITTTGTGTFGGLISPYIAPSADSITAFQIRKADNTTSVLNVDTTNGNVGIGTTSPDTLLSLANDNWISAKNFAETSFINMFKVNADNEIDVGANINIEGYWQFPEDGGQITHADMPVTSTPSDGDEMSLSHKIGGDTILKVYSEADGAGGVKNKKIIVSGDNKADSFTLSDLNTAPANASDTGTKGEIRITATALYVCTDTDTWVKADLASW